VHKSLVIPAFFLGAIVSGFAVNAIPARAATSTEAGTPIGSAADRVFEIRTYTVAPGQLPLLHKRFRDHTMKLFEKHGMTNVVYFTPVDSALSQTTLVYVMAYPNREAARKAWADFGSDPEWKQVTAASDAEGLKVLKAQSMFVNPTDFSPMK
jgi:NIPSNAP